MIYQWAHIIFFLATLHEESHQELSKQVQESRVRHQTQGMLGEIILQLIGKVFLQLSKQLEDYHLQIRILQIDPYLVIPVLDGDESV